MFCLFFLLGALSKKDCVALSELWISPMEQLGNKAGLCISQYQLGSEGLIWLKNVSGFSSPLFTFYFLLLLGTPLYLVMCVSTLLSVLFIKVMQSYALKQFPISELVWHCKHSSLFGVLSNLCLQ